MENYTFKEALDSLCLESIESAVNNTDIDTVVMVFLHTLIIELIIS